MSNEIEISVCANNVKEKGSYTYFAYFVIFCMYGISRMWNICSVNVSMMSLISEHQICQRTNLTAFQM